ncbi:hypothetical protein PSYMO_35081, partial [Pseudomonas amygdali pv. mori str. 301020]
WMLARPGIKAACYHSINEKDYAETGRVMRGMQEAGEEGSRAVGLGEDGELASAILPVDSGGLG